MTASDAPAASQPPPPSTPGAPGLPEAERVRPDPLDAKVLKELEKPPRPERSWYLNLLILAGSLLLFLAAGMSLLENLLILMVVLLVHESGHYAAKLAFGYRNLQMIFIPFVGAGVTGSNPFAAPWQRMVVTLAGPAPGMLLGAALLVAALPSASYTLGMWGKFFLILNALNLLPVYPLDGGHLINDLVFNRHRGLEAAFKGLAGAAILGLAFLLFLLPGASASGPIFVAILAVIGLGVLLSAHYGWQVGSLTEKVRRDLAGTEPPPTAQVPNELAGLLLWRTRAAFPNLKDAKLLAERVRRLWEDLHWTPPGAGTAAVGLGAYALFISLALAAAFVLFGTEAGRRLNKPYWLREWDRRMEVGLEHHQAGRAGEAVEEHRKMLALAEEHDRGAGRAARLAESRRYLGRALRSEAERREAGSLARAELLNDAKAQLETALREWAEAGREHTLEYADTLNELGRIESARGDFARAAQCFEQALRLFNELQGPDHRDSRTVRGCLEEARRNAGSFLRLP